MSEIEKIIRRLRRNSIIGVLKLFKEDEYGAVTYGESLELLKSEIESEIKRIK